MTTKNQSFDLSVNILRSLLMQDGNHPRITLMLTNKNNWLEKNNKGFWEDWYKDVFNLKTASLFGCAVWSRILGVSMNVPFIEGDANFGFGPAGNGRYNFTNGNFGRGETIITAPSVEEQRLLLQLRAYTLTTNCNLLDVNAAFAKIVKSPKTLYVKPNGTMTIKYVFSFAISNDALNIIKTVRILPTPAAVAATLEFPP